MEGGLLLVGAPSSGKTTVLRDIARQLSSGSVGAIRRVAVIDERGELAGVYKGMRGIFLGLAARLDGYPKAQGILQAVRSLAPDYILCDEIGSLKKIPSLFFNASTRGDSDCQHPCRFTGGIFEEKAGGASDAGGRLSDSSFSEKPKGTGYNRRAPESGGFACSDGSEYS